MKSISKLKKELDKWFSLFIRIRDSKNGFAQDCFAIRQLLKFSSNEFLRKEMVAKVQL